MGTRLARSRKAQRASALRAVAGGQRPLREVLRDVPDDLATCPVHRVLEAAPFMGPHKTRKVLESAMVWPLLALGDLNKFQRRTIIAQLSEVIE